MLKQFKFMKKALHQAHKALELNEWPVGAVVIANNKIIASARNMVESSDNPTAHAEIIAANRAKDFLQTRYLENCTLFVTLEPCPMCFHYLETLRIGKIIYGAYRSDNMQQGEHLGGVFELAALRLLKMFGNQLRSK